MPSDLTAVSLFAGVLAGGFDLALERCGVRVVAAVEIDPDCRGVLARHFPETTLFGDIMEVTGDQLRAAGFVPERGIVTAGFPCQDMSIAGRRAGLGGARSGLFWQIMRLADELRPQWLLLENVPGLLSSVCSCPGDDTCVDNGRVVAGGCGDWQPAKPDATERLSAWFHFRRATWYKWVPGAPHGVAGGACPAGCMAAHGGAMGTILGALGERGYGFCGRVLDSRFFHVAQRRERVFIVGCLGDRAAPVQVLLEPEGGAGDLAARREAGQVAAGGAANGLGGAGVAGTITANAGRHAAGNANEPDLLVTGTLTSHMMGDYDDNTARGGFMVTIPLLEVGARTGRSADDPRVGIGIGSDGDPMFTLQAGKRHGVAIPVQDARAMDKAQNGLGVGAPGDPAYTLDATGAQAVATLQGGGRRGHRIDAEGAAGGHLVVSGAVSHAITSREGKGADSDATSGFIVQPVAHALTSEGADASEDGTGRGTPLVLVPRPVPMAFDSWTGGDMRLGHGDTPTALHGGGRAAVHLPDVAAVSENQRGEVLETAYSRQLSAGGGKPGQGYGAVRVETAVRRLTPRECERLQNLPDDWTRWKAVGGKLVELSDSARYRAIGNAVTVSVPQWIIQRIVAADAGIAP